jgi:hypothetical protein
VTCDGAHGDVACPEESPSEVPCYEPGNAIFIGDTAEGVRDQTVKREVEWRAALRKDSGRQKGNTRCSGLPRDN